MAVRRAAQREARGLSVLYQEDYERAVAIGRAGLGRRAFDTAWARGWGLAVELGEPASAGQLGQDTVARCRQVLGPDHLITWFVAQVTGIGSSPTGTDDPGANLPLQPQ